MRGHIEPGELAALEFGKGRGGDHGGVVGGKSGGREVDRVGQARGARALRAVRSCRPRRRRRSGCAHRSIRRRPRRASAVRESRRAGTKPTDRSVACGVTASHSSVEGAVFSRSSARRAAISSSMVVRLHPAQHRRLESAETEIERVALHFREGEAHRARVAVRAPAGRSRDRPGSRSRAVCRPCRRPRRRHRRASCRAGGNGSPRALRTGACGRRSPPARAPATPPACRRGALPGSPRGCGLRCD